MRACDVALLSLQPFSGEAQVLQGLPLHHERKAEREGEQHHRPAQGLVCTRQLRPQSWLTHCSPGRAILEDLVIGTRSCRKQRAHSKKVDGGLNKQALGQSVGSNGLAMVGLRYCPCSEGKR